MSLTTTPEYVVAYEDTGTPVSQHAPVHKTRSGAQSEADARNRARAENGGRGPVYVVVTRDVTPWVRA